MRYNYLLTDKGSDFFGVLAAMSRWGDKWLADEAGAAGVLHHDACGRDTHADVVCHECRQPLEAADVTARPGPAIGTASGQARRPAPIRPCCHGA